MRGIHKLISACVAALLLVLAVPSPAFTAERRYVAPVQAEIIRGFEPPSNQFGAGHRGIDYGVSPGTSVMAAGAGTVTFAGAVADDRYVTIQHSDGISTTYSSLAGIEVSEGQRVSQGQVIAASGQGHAGGVPVLHYGAKLHGDYIDPLSLLTDFDDISDLLQLQPASDAGGHGSTDFGASPVTTFVGSERFNPPVRVAPLPQTEYGVPALEPVIPKPAGGQELHPEGDESTLAQSPLGQPGSNGLETGGAAASSFPPLPKPQDAALWWSNLSEAERTSLVENDARRIGRLEGLPAAIRNAANRKALEQEIASLEKARAIATRGLTEAEKAYGGRYWEPGDRRHLAAVESARAKAESLKKRLLNARHLDESLARLERKPNDGLDEDDIYLLDFDTGFALGEGRAVVALGNPDTAENVGIVVPGITNRLSNFAGTLEKSANLRETVFRRHGDDVAQKTSTIAWLGYDSPESVFDAMDRGEAKAGAKRLKSFVENVRSTQRIFGNRTGRISIFGHSYGSTTSALATKNGMKVENLALVGSPGGATHNAKHLVGAERVWAGRFWSDVIRLSTGFALLGDDPTNRNFGSIRIPTCCRFLGHGSYFQMGTRSVRNLANILVGEYDAVS